MNCLKRILALFMCCLLTLAFFGCMKELPVDPTSSSLPASSDGGDEMIPEEGAALTFRTTDAEFGNAIAEKFKEKYGIEVTVSEGGLYDAQKNALEGPSGKGPDVFMSPHDKAIEGVQAGLFLPLDDKIVKNLNETINDVAMKTVTIDGKVCGVPVSIETYVVFYNKALVKGEPATTFEQIAKDAEAYNNPNENKFWYLTDVCTGSPIYPMLSTYGFNLFGPDGTDDENPGFDTPEFEKGLEVLSKYHDVIPISSGDLGNTDFLVTQFVSGKTAYLVGGPWNVKTFKDMGVDFGVAPLPTFDGHTQRPFAFVQNAHVSAYTKYPVAAQLLAEFLVSQESAELLYSKAYKITSRKDISQVAGLAEDLQLNAIATAFTTAVPMPSAKRISYFWTITTSLGPAVFDGQMTPAEGAKKAMEDWNSFLLTE